MPFVWLKKGEIDEKHWIWIKILSEKCVEIPKFCKILISIFWYLAFLRNFFSRHCWFIKEQSMKRDSLCWSIMNIYRRSLTEKHLNVTAVTSSSMDKKGYVRKNKEEFLKKFENFFKELLNAAKVERVQINKDIPSPIRTALDQFIYPSLLNS